MFNVKHMEREELYTTAYMARLKITEDEMAKLEDAFAQMVEYFDKMKEIDVDALEPTTHALLKANRVRSDKVKVSRKIDSILDNAPELEDRFIVIPNVL